MGIPSWHWHVLKGIRSDPQGPPPGTGGRVELERGEGEEEDAEGLSLEPEGQAVAGIGEGRIPCVQWARLGGGPLVVEGEFRGMDHAAGAAAGSGTQQSPNRPPPPPRRDNFAADNAAGAARRGNNGLMFEEPPPEKGVERDMHGFKITGEEYIRKYKEWKPLHQKKEAERMQKWRDMFIKFPGDSYKNRQQFKKLVRDGIPDSSRGEVWMDISGAKKKKVSNPGDYAKMLTTSKKETSPDAANQIELDIPRTFPEHESFRGSEETAMTIKLRNVLMAYANRNKVILTTNRVDSFKERPRSMKHALLPFEGGATHCS